MGDLMKSAILCGLCIGSAVADIDCVGIPSSVRTWGDGNGYLAVTLNGYSGGSWILCGYDQTVGSVTPTVCKGILATLLTGLVAQRPVDILFGTYTDCASVPGFDTTLPGRLKYVTAL